MIGRKVLIIDNEQDLLDVLKTCLSEDGNEVYTFTYADDIFSLIRTYDPDVIVLDYLLNGINGGELCQQIKCNPQTSHLPVVIYSAYPRVMQSFGDYGCDAFISKPFDLDDFIEQLDEVIKHQSDQHIV